MICDLATVSASTIGRRDERHDLSFDRVTSQFTSQQGRSLEAIYEKGEGR